MLNKWKKPTKKPHKKWNCFEKAHTLPEHGGSPSAAEFWWVTTQCSWKGRSNSKDRGAVWQGRLPSFHIYNRQMPTWLSLLFNHPPFMLKTESSCNANCFENWFSIYFHKSFTHQAEGQIPQSTWWETDSMLYRKEKPTPWHSRRQPLIPWACFFLLYSAHLYKKTSGGESCSASLIFIIKLGKMR